MSNEDEAEDEWWKGSLLKLLDTLRRKIETGEVVGMMVFAECDEDRTLCWRRGCHPSAPSIIMLRRYLQDVEDIYIESAHSGEDPDKPSLSVTDEGDDG